MLLSRIVWDIGKLQTYDAVLRKYIRQTWDRPARSDMTSFTGIVLLASSANGTLIPPHAAEEYQRNDFEVWLTTFALPSCPRGRPFITSSYAFKSTITWTFIVCWRIIVIQDKWKEEMWEQFFCTITSKAREHRQKHLIFLETVHYYSRP